MIVERPNPGQVVLQVHAENPDGTPKTALASATVRVYHVNDLGNEVTDLSSTALDHVPGTNIWRYRWDSPGLAVGHFFAEYSLVDNVGASFVSAEDIVIQDFAKQVTLENVEAIVAFIKKIEAGRWRIDQTTDQMIFYDDDDVTPLLTFDLKDIAGLPSHINIFERKPA